MSVMIASKVKDGEIWLPRFLMELEKLTYENISRVVFMYSESRDASFSLLDHYRHTSKHDVEIYADPWLPPSERRGDSLARVKQDIQRLLKSGGEDYYLNLDCDLVQLPVDLIERLMAHDKDLIAGMVLTENRDPMVFYDSYVFRLEGCRFHPYRYPGMDKTEPFEVESVSTCYLAKSHVELAGIYTNPHPHIPFCNDLRNKGYKVWVDPTTLVFHIDLEKMGIVHPPDPGIPYSWSRFIDDKNRKYEPAVIGAETRYRLILEDKIRFAQTLPVSYKVVEDWKNMRPLITASIKVFNDAETLPYTLRSIYPYVDCIDIVEGAVYLRRDHANPDGSSPDGTVDVIKNFPDPDNKINLFTGIWKTKEEIQRKLLEVCRGKWMMFIDADEVMDYSSLSLARKWCFEHQDGQMVYARPIRFFNLYHDFYHAAFSLDPMSPWAEHGIPHPFLIWRDIPGLNFESFHTVPADMFGNPIGRGAPVYRGREEVLDDVFMIHLGYVKSPERMRQRFEFEIRRGIGAPGVPQSEKPEDDPWFTHKMPEDFVITNFPGPYPEILDSHPMKGKIKLNVTKTKPHFEYELVDMTTEEYVELKKNE
jgi:hypothetical protein